MNNGGYMKRCINNEGYMKRCMNKCMKDVWIMEDMWRDVLINVWRMFKKISGIKLH